MLREGTRANEGGTGDEENATRSDATHEKLVELLRNPLKDFIKAYKSKIRAELESYIDKKIEKRLEDKDTGLEATVAEKVKEKVAEKSLKVRNDMLQSLGLFVAFFTFTSISFQFFTKDLSVAHMIALIFILLSTQVLFLIVFDCLLKDRFQKKHRILLFVATVLGLIGLAVYFYGNNNSKSIQQQTNRDHLRLIEEYLNKTTTPSGQIQVEYNFESKDN